MKRINYPFLLYGIVLSALLFLLVGPVLSGADSLWGIVFTQVLTIFFPALFFRGKFGSKKRENMSLGKATSLTIAIFPAILLVNGLFLEGLSHVIVLENQNLDILRESVPLYKQILTMALAPAIMEEYFFRGVLCEQFSRRNPRGAVILSAAVFALFHFELQNSVAPFLFGLVLGYIYLYGGLKACIFSHFLYNVFSILFIHFFNREWIAAFSKAWIVEQVGGVKNATTVVLLLAGVVGIVSILRASVKLPLPGGQKTVQRKEWIPLCLLAVLYVIYAFV